MQENSKKINFKFKKKLCIIPVLIFLSVEIIVYFKLEENNQFISINELIYQDFDSHIIEVNSDHLRIYPPHKCNCTKQLYIKLKQTNSHSYTVYLVRILNIYNKITRKKLTQ